MFNDVFNTFGVYKDFDTGLNISGRETVQRNLLIKVALDALDSESSSKR